MRGTFGNFLEISPSDLEENFRVNTMGMLYLARAFAPSMIERQSGVLWRAEILALRGKPRFSAFAPQSRSEFYVSLWQGISAQKEFMLRI